MIQVTLTLIFEMPIYAILVYKLLFEAIVGDS